MNSYGLSQTIVLVAVIVATITLGMIITADSANGATVPRDLTAPDLWVPMEGVTPVLVGSGWSTTTRLVAVALPDGRLMRVWMEDKPGSEEAGKVQQAMVRYSSDEGGTWTDTQVLFEFPPNEGQWKYYMHRNGQILVDSGGTWHIFGLYYPSDAESSPFHVMSADQGKTWSEVQFLPLGYRYGGFHNQSVLQLSTGRIVVPIWHRSEQKPQRVIWENISCISDDGGKTWRRAKEHIDENTEANIDETTLVELPDGRIWGLSRADGGHQYEAYSDDGGETWYGVQPSRFVSPFAPAALKRLDDGRIIVAWNNSLKPEHVINRLVVAAAISDDDGQTWRGYREIARTTGGPDRGTVTYPSITQAPGGTVFVTYDADPRGTNIVKLDPDWLEESSLSEDFSEGLDNWITFKTKGIELVEHPVATGKRVMALRKPDADTAAGASLNFPFGAQGELSTRLLLRPGFHGVRLTLTDHFTWPYYAEEGAFSLSIAPNGTIEVGQGESEYEATDVILHKSKWYELTLQWDAERGKCQLLVDGESVAELPELANMMGVCYLRLWSEAEHTDRAGILVESVSVKSQP